MSNNEVEKGKFTDPVSLDEFSRFAEAEHKIGTAAWIDGLGEEWKTAIHTALKNRGVSATFRMLKQLEDPYPYAAGSLRKYKNEQGL